MILVLTSFLSYLRSHFSALGKYSHEAWLSGLDKLLMIVVLGYFLFIKNEISIHLFIGGQIIALLISCLVFIFYLRGIFALSIRFSLKETLALIKKTIPYALVLLLMTLYTRLDGVMLERLLDDNAYSAGVYARSFRLLDAANMIAILFATLMLPMFSKLMNDRIQLKSLVEEVSRLLFVVCLMVCMVSWFYAKDIMDFIYINNTSEHYLVFKFLLLSFFAMGMSNIFGCLFLASQKLKQINILFFVGILMNLSLNYILIPERGAYGAVVATLVTQFFVFIGQAVLAIQVFKLKFHYSTLMGFALISVASFFIFKTFNIYIHWSWMIALLMISFLMLVLAFFFLFLRFSVVSKR